jgi:hypothetical protein
MFINTNGSITGATSQTTILTYANGLQTTTGSFSGAVSVGGQISGASAGACSGPVEYSFTGYLTTGIDNSLGNLLICAGGVEVAKALGGIGEFAISGTKNLNVVGGNIQLNRNTVISSTGVGTFAAGTTINSVIPAIAVTGPAACTAGQHYKTLSGVLSGGTLTLTGTCD